MSKCGPTKKRKNLLRRSLREQKRRKLRQQQLKKQHDKYIDEIVQRSIARNPDPKQQVNIAASFTKSFQGDDTGCINDDGTFSPDYHTRTR